MHRFARTLQCDLDAVRNAVTEPWSNGQTEGQISRLKTLKRAMYGQAEIELLRARLYATQVRSSGIRIEGLMADDDRSKVLTLLDLRDREKCPVRSRQNLSIRYGVRSIGGACPVTRSATI